MSDWSLGNLTATDRTDWDIDVVAVAARFLASRASGAHAGSALVGAPAPRSIGYVSTLRGQPLREPLKVEYEAGDDGIIAFAPTLKLGGLGASVSAATVDLERNLFDVKDEFEATPSEQLDESAKALLARINALLV